MAELSRLDARAIWLESLASRCPICASRWAIKLLRSLLCRIFCIIVFQSFQVIPNRTRGVVHAKSSLEAACREMH